MKSTSKFFLGLTCGLAVSLFSLNSTSNLSASSQKDTKVASTVAADIDGKWVTKASMQSKIQSYETQILPKLPQGSSKGGFIKRSVLKEITGRSYGDYIKYSFYHEGEGKIGLVFESQAETTNVLITTKAAFCPTMCNYPSN
jgi:hypothetical protein